MFNNMLGKAALQTVSGPFLYREHENVTLRAKFMAAARNA